MIDTSLPAGLYKGSIMLSVVVNPIQAVSINDLYYMQDIKPEICAASKIWSNDSDSKILIDYRDGKKYKVAKLKDGNCWMQQNLTLGLSKSTPLTSADSDVTTTWTPPSDITSADNMTYSAGIALAGSQTSATANGAEYSSSICPKGWKLPLAATLMAISLEVYIIWWLICIICPPDPMLMPRFTSLVVMIMLRVQQKAAVQCTQTEFLYLAIRCGFPMNHLLIP